MSAGALAQAEAQLATILDQEPERDVASGVCINAWCDLGTCRAIGMAVGPIPWTAIVTWCEVHGLDRETTGLISTVIRMVDNDRAEAAEAKRRIEELRKRGPT
jgi:hypothetical protein